MSFRFQVLKFSFVNFIIFTSLRSKENGFCKLYKTTVKPLKKGAMGNMDVDKVDDMMADIQDAQDTSNEIADAIARPMGMQVTRHNCFSLNDSLRKRRLKFDSLIYE